MSDKQMVLGIFADEAAADAAVDSLKAWDKASPEDHAGVPSASSPPMIAARSRSISWASAARRRSLASAWSWRSVAPPTLLAGMVGGGVLGHFHHKGLGLTGMRTQAP